jgi:hypothetical protein
MAGCFVYRGGRDGSCNLSARRVSTIKNKFECTCCSHRGCPTHPRIDSRVHQTFGNCRRFVEAHHLLRRERPTWSALQEALPPVAGPKPSSATRSGYQGSSAANSNRSDQFIPHTSPYVIGNVIIYFEIRRGGHWKQTLGCRAVVRHCQMASDHSPDIDYSRVSSTSLAGGLVGVSNLTRY